MYLECNAWQCDIKLTQPILKIWRKFQKPQNPPKKIKIKIKNVGLSAWNAWENKRWWVLEHLPMNWSLV